MGEEVKPSIPWFRNPITVGLAALGAIGAAYQLAGVLTVFLSNAVLILGVWAFLTIEAAYSNWIRRSGHYRPSLILIVALLSGLASLFVSGSIAKAKHDQALNSPPPDKPAMAGPPKYSTPSLNVEEVAKDIVKELNHHKIATLPDTRTPVQRLTNLQLKKQVESFTDGLRKFDKTHEEQEAEFERDNPRPHAHEDDPQSMSLWNFYNQRIANRERDFASQFGERYLPQARSLHTELLRRTNIATPYEDIQTKVALEGQLVGPNPLLGLANDLDYLADQLP